MVENVNRFSVWTNNLINDFGRMVQQHHEILNNFHRVGAMLEASGQIYGFRVDSLHADVIRMSSGIQRQSLGHSDLDSTVVSDLISDIGLHTTLPIRRKRPACTTVVGNSDLINAPLQALEEMKCPLNRITGITGASHLFQHVLCSDRYVWTLQSKGKFWLDRNVVNGLEEFNELDEANVEFPVVNWIPSNADAVRPKLCGYRMESTACENFRYTDSSTAARLNQPHLDDNDQIVEMDDLHFDIDVDPVPVNNSQRTMPPIDFSLNEVDRNAVDDMRPLSSTPLSYSYRRLINGRLSTDAGLHWTLPSIMQSVLASPDSNNSERQGARRRKRRKIVEKDRPVIFTHGDSFEQNFMSVDDSRVASIRKSNQSRWQPAKLTMPSRMGHSTAVRFLPLMLEAATVPDSPTDSAVVTDMDLELEPCDMDMEMNMDPVDVTQSGSNVADVPVTGIILEEENHDVAVEVDMDPIDVNQSGPNLVAIDMTIDGAPDVPDVILPPMLQAPFHITRANVDIKAITRRCLEIICDLDAVGGEISFGRVYAQLQADGQVITPALIFSSILELANRNNFRLEKIDGMNDFVIKRF